MTKPKAKITQEAAKPPRTGFKLLVVEIDADSAKSGAAFLEAIDTANRALVTGQNVDTKIERDGSVARVSVQHR